MGNNFWWCVLLVAVVFVVLSPGVLLNLPPLNWESGQVTGSDWGPNWANPNAPPLPWLQILVHGFVAGLAVALLKNAFGMKDNDSMSGGWF